MANSNDTSKAQQGADLLNTASAIAGQVLNTVGAYIDQNQRRKFEQTLSTLTLEQQQKLSKEVNQQASEVERFRIISDAVTKLNAQRISNISNPTIEAEKNKRLQYIYIGIGLIASATIILYIISKQK
jgi:hypothetical protein